MNENNKRLLCLNTLNNKNICKYGSKCVYSHSLEEQKVDPLRHKAYTIVKNNFELSNINLVKDKKLFSTLVELTRVCYYCSKNKCTGGYNCRNGVISFKYKVCNDDLLYGNCRKIKCNGVHLTEKGLTPYYIQMRKFKQVKMPVIKSTRRLNLTQTSMMMTKKYMLHDNKEKYNSSDSIESDDIKKMEIELNREYNDSYDSYDECIFIE